MSGKTTIVNEHGVPAEVNSSNELLVTDSSLSDVKVDSGEGNNIRTSNVNTESTQNEILKQLKIMNIQLAILTGNEIEKTEV